MCLKECCFVFQERRDFSKVQSWKAKGGITYIAHKMTDLPFTKCTND